jgi:putative tricarboxylic transport membrane protein
MAIGSVGLWGAGRIRQPGGYSPVGPRVFPYVVSIGLLAFGLLFLARATIWPDRELLAKAGEEAAGTHWPTPLLLGGWLIVYAFLLPSAGYVIATALFVPINARILGSTKPRRDAVVGALLAVILYLAFTRFLGVRLPAGLLDIG